MIPRRISCSRRLTSVRNWSAGPRASSASRRIRLIASNAASTRTARWKQRSAPWISCWKRPAAPSWARSFASWRRPAVVARDHRHPGVREREARLRDPGRRTACGARGPSTSAWCARSRRITGARPGPWRSRVTAAISTARSTSSRKCCAFTARRRFRRRRPSVRRSSMQRGCARRRSCFNRRKVTEYLVGQHFHECVSYTLCSARELKTWVSDAAVQELGLLNPFVEEQSHLRSSLLLEPAGIASSSTSRAATMCPV